MRLCCPRRSLLTFDNGPTPGVTDRVLDMLSQRHMSAIFFVVGENISSPAGHRLVTRAVREGHRIGNHSFTHGLPLGERALCGGNYSRNQQHAKAFGRFHRYQSLL